MFSRKATKIAEIFTVNLTLCSNCQINGADFFNFCGLLRKHERQYSKFIFSKKATKIDGILTINLTLTT